MILNKDISRLVDIIKERIQPKKIWTYSMKDVEDEMDTEENGLLVVMEQELSVRKIKRLHYIITEELMEQKPGVYMDINFVSNSVFENLKTKLNTLPGAAFNGGVLIYEK